MSERVDVTVLLPCLDESATVGACVGEARDAMDAAGIAGEVLVADNGSTDESVALAEAAGARIERVERRGYGAALRAGIAAARGDIVVMADADLSYDLSQVPEFVAAIRRGADLVMGDRFAGGIARGAMPLKNRLVGNPFLSWLGRRLTGTRVRDFHCGMRAFRRSAVGRLPFRSTGMEFASEMVALAARAGLRIEEIPTTLRVDGRGGASHLRPLADGSRHVAMLWMLAPRSTLAAVARAVLGILVLVMSVLTIRDVTVGGVTFSIGSLIVVSVAVVSVGLVVSFDAALRGDLARPTRRRHDEAGSEREIAAPGRVASITLPVLVVGGMLGLVRAVVGWAGKGFGDLDPTEVVRGVVMPGSMLILAAGVVLGRLIRGLSGFVAD